MNWYKKAQFGLAVINVDKPHKNKINLHLNRAMRDVSSVLSKSRDEDDRKKLRHALEQIGQAQRKIDFAI
tara:strand:- start:117083 stop:117292 length:210 start_codon:yes stop_codon:yes gene_type:complete